MHYSVLSMVDYLVSSQCTSMVKSGLLTARVLGMVDTLVGSQCAMHAELCCLQ